MKDLHREYKELYDKYHKLLDDLAEQKKKSHEHESIKKELEVMRQLLNMKRLSIGLGDTGID